MKKPEDFSCGSGFISCLLLLQIEIHLIIRFTTYGYSHFDEICIMMGFVLLAFLGFRPFFSISSFSSLLSLLRLSSLSSFQAFQPFELSTFSTHLAYKNFARASFQVCSKQDRIGRKGKRNGLHCNAIPDRKWLEPCCDQKYGSRRLPTLAIAAKIEWWTTSQSCWNSKSLLWKICQESKVSILKMLLWNKAFYKRNIFLYLFTQP